MGGGTYSFTNRAVRTASFDYASKSVDQIFEARTLESEMNPKGLNYRESRDSEEHPNSLPVIINLDLTGSMGEVPRSLITDGLPKIMSNIIQNGVPDPQILFVGVGDHECDRAPLQVSQFESSDELLDKWLKMVYLERGGGGNGGESYLLAWYVAARYTKMDHYEKRGKKGILFTIGDEPNLQNLPAEDQLKIMGNGQYKDVTADILLKEVSEKYEVYHIHVRDTYNGQKQFVIDGWKQTLGENCIVAESHREVPSIIARIVAENQGVENVVITEDAEELAKAEKERSKDNGLF